MKRAFNFFLCVCKNKFKRSIYIRISVFAIDVNIADLPIWEYCIQYKNLFSISFNIYKNATSSFAGNVCPTYANLMR